MRSKLKKGWKNLKSRNGRRYWKIKITAKRGLKPASQVGQ
jgi:hypothetical protein